MSRKTKRKRLAFRHERTARKKGFRIVVGVDEAGRGPLAGPLVVAAVALRDSKFRARIDDSKKLTARQRETAFREILDKAVCGIDVVSPNAIDTLRIVAGARLAVNRAASKVLRSIRKPSPSAKNTILLLDGALGSDLGYPVQEIIGGDGKCLSIAAASIVAKVVRDHIMEIYDRIYPQYGFRFHKGYGTRKHFQHIRHHGLSPIHRKTYCQGAAARA